jgi:HPt (histidine-containing phosphotransfer) domain-containing protein
VAGNRKLYLNLLSQFVTQQSDIAPQVAGALDAGDRRLAERLAHTVKGVAGNLGITEVQIAAQKLEKAIREDHPDVPALLDQFAITVRVHVNSIRRALPDVCAGQAAPAISAPFDRERATAAVNRLQSLLEASDGDSQEAFEALQQAVVGVVDKPHLDALNESINNFDFEQALTKLHEIAELCKRNGN